MAPTPIITQILEGKDATGQRACVFYATVTQNVFGFLMPGGRDNAQAFIDFLGKEPTNVDDAELKRAWRFYNEDKARRKYEAKELPDGRDQPAAGGGKPAG